MHLLIRAGCYPFRLLRYTFTFCWKLFCRRPQIIFAYTSVGLMSCLLCLQLKRGSSKSTKPDREPTEGRKNRGSSKSPIPDQEPTEDGEKQESIPDRETTDVKEKQESIPDRETTDVKENPRSIPDREPTDKEENAGHNEPYRVERTDLLYCEYDTTWETLEYSQGDRRPRGSTQRVYDYEFNRFENAAKDMYNYRHDYPLPMGRSYHRGKQGTDMPNLTFYLGERASEPDGFSIGEFHKTWCGDYYRLERVHSFVQWIFPLQEVGMNDEAFVLTKQEIEAFLKNETAKLNLQQSYGLMLDFYGIELSNLETGAVRRASNWPERFENMNWHTHNNMRLTRILKCLGTLGFRHYQAPLVRFFLEETLVQGNLPAVKESVLNYFLFAVLDRAQRRELVRFAFLNYEPREKFIWCPKKIQEAFLREGRLAGCSNPADPSAEELRQVEENNDVNETKL